LLILVALCTVACAHRSGSEAMTDAIVVIATNDHQISDEELRQAFGIEDAVYMKRREASSLIYKTEERTKAAQYVEMSNFLREQRILVVLSENVCITPDLLKRRTGLNYAPDTRLTHVLGPPGTGGSTVSAPAGVTFAIERERTFSSINVDDTPPCSKTVSISKRF